MRRRVGLPALDDLTIFVPTTADIRPLRDAESLVRLSKISRLVSHAARRFVELLRSTNVNAASMTQLEGKSNAMEARILALAAAEQRRDRQMKQRKAAKKTKMRSFVGFFRAVLPSFRRRGTAEAAAESSVSPRAPSGQGSSGAGTLMDRAVAGGKNGNNADSGSGESSSASGGADTAGRAASGTKPAGKPERSIEQQELRERGRKQNELVKSLGALFWFRDFSMMLRNWEGRKHEFEEHVGTEAAQPFREVGPEGANARAEKGGGAQGSW